MKLLVTGGAGFIGSNFVEYALSLRKDIEIVCLDALTYAGNLENLKDVELDPVLSKRFRFVKGSITERGDVERAFTAVGRADAVVNFAAESHVDRSIDGAAPFVRTNVEGTLILLEEARKRDVKRFLQVSTDEVYGSLLDKDPAFHEELPLRPNNPYSVTKAAADMMVLAFAHTHGMDVVVTRSSNNYGPRQYPEKLIPLIISNAMEGKDIPVYGDGLQVRDWLNVRDNCGGILAALEKGKAGEIYNLGGASEITNIKVVQTILKILGKPESLIKYVKDRPGHDRRYAIDFTKAATHLGYYPMDTFQEGILDTIEWYRKNQDWVARVKSGEYRDYYKARYG